jgi:hypothetical protein
MPAWSLFVVIEASAGSFRPTMEEVDQRFRAGVALYVVHGDLTFYAFAIANVIFVSAFAFETEAPLIFSASECRQRICAYIKYDFLKSGFFWSFSTPSSGGEAGLHRVPRLLFECTVLRASHRPQSNRPGA